MESIHERRRRGDISDPSGDEKVVKFNAGQSAFHEEDGYILRSRHDNSLAGLLLNPPPEPYTDSKLQKGCFALVSGLGVTTLRERPPDIAVEGSVLTFVSRPFQDQMNTFYNLGNARITGHHVPGGTENNPGGTLYYEVLHNRDDEKIAEVREGGMSEWDEGGPAEEVVTSVVGDDSVLFQPRQWNKVKVNCFEVPGSRCFAPLPSATMC
jgi:hypothetical protein